MNALALPARCHRPRYCQCHLHPAATHRSGTLGGRPLPARSGWVTWRWQSCGAAAAGSAATAGACPERRPTEPRTLHRHRQRRHRRHHRHRRAVSADSPPSAGGRAPAWQAAAAAVAAESGCGTRSGRGPACPAPCRHPDRMRRGCASATAPGLPRRCRCRCRWHPSPARRAPCPADAASSASCCPSCPRAEATLTASAANMCK